MKGFSESLKKKCENLKNFVSHSFLSFINSLRKKKKDSFL